MKIQLPTPSQPESLVTYPDELLAETYRRMVLIREFELKVHELFLRGLMPGTIHLSHGQEATTVGACMALKKNDVFTLSHLGQG